ncbi:MAG: Nramp family divalent metal transporter, partial [Candidatus Anstonellaceae archaeon]
MSLKSRLSSALESVYALSDKRFWMFFGTGLIVSVAYMDPGNWGTSISAGAQYNYLLLWAIWFSSGAAMLFQYLSGKLGIAGHTIGDLVRQRWGDKRLVFGYWLLAELAILATDLAEFLGIVV